MNNPHEVLLEINLLVNSLNELFNELHCTEAKARLQEAHMWAEHAIKMETGGSV